MKRASFFLGILLSSTLLFFGCSNGPDCDDYSLAASPSTATVGETVTLNIVGPEVSGYDLYDTKLKPKDTPNFHRFIIQLGPKAAKKFTVNSRHETYSTFSIWDYNKKNLLKNVKTYIDEKWITAEKEGKLKEIADFLEELQSIRSTLSKKETDLQEIFNTQDRLRQNIQSIGTSRSEIELREKYVKKLDEQETLVEGFEKDIREMKEKADETSGKITLLLAALEKEE